MITAEQLEILADSLDGSEKPIMSGIVLAGGLSRLLDKLAAEPARQVPHDLELNEEGEPVKVKHDPSQRLIRIEKCRPFGIVSAYRGKLPLQKNMDRSALLLKYINNLITSGWTRTVSGS